MKKLQSSLWILGAIVTASFLFSCQKSADGSIDTPTISSKNDPQAVSAAASVWHGKRITGTVPATNNPATLQLNTPDEPTIEAIAGRYAVFKPSVRTGEVAGYYVQIDGAKEYFKVDYTKPVVTTKTNGQTNTLATAGAFNPKHPQKATKPRSIMGVAGDDDQQNFSDSAIVINLPPNIKTPDTICVRYWAYDYNNNVSNPITTCIYINHLGGDNNSNWLQGSWKITTEEIYLENQLKEKYNILYNKWINDFYGTRCYKREDSLIKVEEYRENYNYYNYYSFKTGDNYEWSSTPFIVKSTDVLLATDSIFYKKYFVAFKTDGFYNGETYSIEKDIDWYSSSLNSIAFHIPNEEDDIFNGAWSYNSTTNKMVLIEEYNNSYDGTVETYVTECAVEKVSNNIWKLVFADKDYLGRDLVWKMTMHRQ